MAGEEPKYLSYVWLGEGDRCVLVGEIVSFWDMEFMAGIADTTTFGVFCCWVYACIHRHITLIRAIGREGGKRCLLYCIDWCVNLVVTLVWFFFSSKTG